MSRFIDDASGIFEAAAAAPDGASDALTILIHAQGQIHIVDGAGTSIDALQELHGCQTAFRVTRGYGRLRVEGHDGSSRCILEKESKARVPAGVLSGLFIDRPLYSMTNSLAVR